MATEIEYRQEVALYGVDRELIAVLDAANGVELDLAELGQRYGRTVARVAVHGFERHGDQDLGRIFGG